MSFKVGDRLILKKGETISMRWFGKTSSGHWKEEQITPEDTFFIIDLNNIPGVLSGVKRVSDGMIFHFYYASLFDYFNVSNISRLSRKLLL